MGLTLITPPDYPVVVTSQVRAHLRIDGTAEDGYLDGLVSAATSLLDGATGLLGRALRPQTWRQTFDCFPDVMHLRLPPLRSVTSITYTDPNGVERTLANTEYLVRGLGEDDPTVHPALGKSWPSTAHLPGAVSVTFSAGYDVVPPIVVQAVLMQVGTWYANRESSTISTGLALQIDGGVSEMLSGLKLRRF